MFLHVLHKVISAKNVFFFSILVFLVYLTYRIALISYPHPDAGGVENNVTWFIQQLLDGNRLYSDPESRPYSIAQYSPLYYYICAGIGKLAGISSDDVFSVFILSRIVSLLFNLLYAVVLILIARKIFNCHFRVSILPGLFSFIFLDITTFSRPDSLYHVFFFSSLYLFWKWINSTEQGGKTCWTLLYSAMAAAAGLFAKQSAIVLPAIIAIWLVYRKQRVPLLKYFSAYAAVVILLLWIVNRESGLRVFYQNAVLGLDNGIGLYWFWSNIMGGFYLQFGLLLVPLLIAVLILSANKERERFRFLFISAIVVFIFSNLTALKWGSSAAYFTEWIGLTFLGVAVFMPTLSEVLKKIHFSFLPLLVLWVLLVKVSRILYPLSTVIDAGERAKLRSVYSKEKQVAEHMQSLLQKEQTSFVFNNVYSPKVWLNNFMFRETVLPQYEIVIFGSWKQKAYDYGGFKKEFEKGGVPYILMTTNISPPTFLNIVFQKYSLVDSLNGYYIYKFKP